MISSLYLWKKAFPFLSQFLPSVFSAVKQSYSRECVLSELFHLLARFCSLMRTMIIWRKESWLWQRWLRTIRCQPQVSLCLLPVYAGAADSLLVPGCWEWAALTSSTSLFRSGWPGGSWLHFAAIMTWKPAAMCLNPDAMFWIELWAQAEPALAFYKQNPAASSALEGFWTNNS